MHESFDESHDMPLKFPSSLPALLLMAAFSAAVRAEPAHVHGVAALDISVQGDTLRLALESPLDNLIGFEHAPSGDGEHAKVRTMARQLRQAWRWFVPNPEAACKLASVTLSSAVIAPVELGEPVTKTAPAASQAEPGHADLDAGFVFQCAHPLALKTMEVRLFDAFAGFRQIQVQSVTAKRQSAARLTPDARTFVW
ncbi:MAG: ABC-type metal ion transport system, periplasmic component/surface adhesin [Proteobacteria bacterium]|nr:ABC-type metal ion transport system, periplasmic component/surface adhesin [Pseudomonadota bacterium]